MNYGVSECLPAQVGREVERLQLCAAIAQCPECSRCRWELITGVGEMLQLRTVNTAQPQESGRR